jgi:hypothetical protein
MSASICSFVTAGLLTLIGGGLAAILHRGQGRRGTAVVESVRS